jgi:two-component system LytT family sensor kinase
VDQKLVLITLLVKLGVAAAAAGALVRSRIFKGLLYKEERTVAEKVYLALFICLPFVPGVWVRMNVKNFLAADLSLEVALLVGAIGGRVAGAVAGGLLALPALFGGEYFALPFLLGSGLLGGLMRVAARDKEVIWTFSPFIDLSIYRWLRRNLRQPQLEWQTLFFFTIFGLEAVRVQLGNFFPSLLFHLYFHGFWTRMAIYATAVVVVAIPLKVWNVTRIEMKLEEQQRLLLEARMQALQTQINPHFLFNTLNSVSSLVRFDPDTARDLIVKLANILRRLLRKTDAFVPLREELEFLDDYLEIERVRFGADKLQVVKDVDPASLETVVPSMLLQPLVENSIKHGLATKLQGGSITLRTRVAEARLIIEVEDNGVGMTPAPAARADGVTTTGIGMANVEERLRVLFGDKATMTVASNQGEGTIIRLELPVVQTVEDGVPTFAEIVYETRSSSPR